MFFMMEHGSFKNYLLKGSLRNQNLPFYGINAKTLYFEEFRYTLKV